MERLAEQNKAADTASERRTWNVITGCEGYSSTFVSLLPGTAVQHGEADIPKFSHASRSAKDRTPTCTKDALASIRLYHTRRAKIVGIEAALCAAATSASMSQDSRPSRGKLPNLSTFGSDVWA